MQCSDPPAPRPRALHYRACGAPANLRKCRKMSFLLLPDDDPILRVVPMPGDANAHGDVFGGWIMAQVDLAGGVLAARRANGRVATVAVTSFLFKEPVFVGDLLSLFGRIVRSGRTSVTIDVAAFAERSRMGGEVVKVTEATLVYVATDEQRRPRELPPLPETPAQGR
jgi:acyl-CoA thioesterase YciA